MSQLVPIAPGVVFSPDVLAASWGTEYRGDASTRQADFQARALRQTAESAEVGASPSRDVASAQMSLL